MRYPGKRSEWKNFRINEMTMFPPPIPLCTENNKRYSCLRCVEERREHLHFISSQLLHKSFVSRCCNTRWQRVLQQRDTKDIETTKTLFVVFLVRLSDQCVWNKYWHSVLNSCLPHSQVMWAWREMWEHIGNTRVGFTSVSQSCRNSGDTVSTPPLFYFWKRGL